MKRKLLLVLTVIILTVSLTSCLDAIQYITLDKNGDIELSFMITISKSLVEMGGDGQSVEDTFTDEVLNPDDITSMIPRAKNVEARLVDSDVDYGYLFKFTLPRNYQPEEGTPMAPRINRNSLEILLTMDEGGDQGSGDGSGDQSMDESMDEMSEAIFSSAKYKVQISKKLLPNATKAYLRTTDDEITTVDLIDLGDNYLVNLPMLLAMMNEGETYLVFEF